MWNQKIEKRLKERLPEVIREQEWGIPVLDIKLEGDKVDTPFMQWGTVSRVKPMRGTYAFYIEDYRFNALWQQPEKLVNSECISVVEPNITIVNSTPKACVLSAIYYKRAIARYWQSEGIRVFVDMSVPAEFEELNLLGVPSKWRAYCTHGYVNRIEALKREHKLACSHAGTKDILWVVYGGGLAIRELCEKKGWLHIPEHFDVQKGKFSFAPYQTEDKLVNGRERKIA